ncbi:MAG: co-chaperone GroES [Pirellulales bacterium]|nr:co-chaperone GroES [Pirellulales bacterium]
MKLVPLGDNVVVKPLEAETRTAAGIVLPEAAREKSQQGRVLSVGDGRLLLGKRRVPLQVNEGDRVLFSAYAGNEVQVNGDTLLVLREADILAVLD